MAGFCLPIWLYAAAYGAMMARWSAKRLWSLLFPLLLLLGAILWVDSPRSFLLLALGVFSWLRSGICCEKKTMAVICAELVLVSGGALLIFGLAPQAPLGRALGVWLFFLIQTLYWVLFEPGGQEAESACADSFEQARRGAQKIVASL
jgi:hypothetical protein